MAQLDNPRHEAFAQAVASGMTGADAYRKVYGKVKAPRAGACDLNRDFPDVPLRVKELQAESKTETVMDMRERRELAATIARDKEQKAADRIAAIMADAKLAGELVDRVEATVRVPLTPEQISEAVKRSPALAMIGRS